MYSHNIFSPLYVLLKDKSKRCVTTKNCRKEGAVKWNGFTMDAMNKYSILGNAYD